MINLILKRFWAVLMAGILAGCSGGGAFQEETDSGTTTGGSTTKIITNLPDDASVQVVVLDDGQPADGTSAVELRVYVKNNAGLPLADVQVVLAFSDNSLAIARSSSDLTDADGIYYATMTNEFPQTIQVTPIVGNEAQTPQIITFTTPLPPVVEPPDDGGDDTPSLPEDAVVQTLVVDDQQPANGVSAVQVIVVVRDRNGLALVDIPVELAFSEGSFAVASIPSGVTDNNGRFAVQITDLIAETVAVTPVVDKNRQAAVLVHFIAKELPPAEQEPDVASVGMVIPKRSAVGDGSESLQLITVVRDSNGVPLAGIPLVFSSSSQTAVLDTLLGETDTNGRLTLTVTDTVVESVQIIAVAGGKQTTTETLNFMAPPVPEEPPEETDDRVGRITVPEVRNNGQPADGSQTVMVIVYAYDKTGKPAAGRTTNVILSTGSAIASPATGSTDQSGRFMFTLTDTFVESFTVQLEVDGVLSPVSPSIQFIGLPSGDGENESQPADLELLVPLDNQPADGVSPVYITVVVRDRNGVPLSGVPVRLSGLSTDAQFAATSGVTLDNGTFNTTITNTVAELFTVTAWVEDNPELLQQLEVHFEVPTTTTPGGPQEDYQIAVEVRNNEQPADGQSAVIVDVFAKTKSGVPVAGAAVILYFLKDTGQCDPANAGCFIASVSATPVSGGTDENGRFQTSLTNTRPETVNVKVQVLREGETIDLAKTMTSEPIEFLPNYKPGTPPQRVELTLDSQTVTADGQTPVFVTIIARDANNAPIANAPVVLSSIGEITPVITPETGTTGNIGEFTAQITSAQAGSVQINASVNNVRASAQVSFTSEDAAIQIPPGTAVQLIADRNSANADGLDPIVLTATVSANNERLRDMPVRLELTPVEKPAADALFGTNGGQGVSDTDGIFRTTLTSIATETVQVAAIVGDHRSETITVSFAQAVQQAAALVLLTDSPQLLSGGDDVVVITALLKDVNNNPVAEEQIQFGADSGTIEIQGDGKTNLLGTATALLRTTGEPNNRVITVTASAAGIVDTPEIQVEVVGTALTISGPTNTTSRDSPSFAISLRDSALTGIGSKEITVRSEAGNTIGNVNGEPQGAEAKFITNRSGQVDITVIKPVQTIGDTGQDNITVSYQGGIPASHTYNISNDIFCVVREPHATARDGFDPIESPDTLPPNDFCNPGANTGGELAVDADIPVNTPVYYTVYWEKPGEDDTEKTNKVARVSTTRGLMLANSNQTEPCQFASTSTIEAGHGHGVPLAQLDTILYSQARFMICSNNAGPAVIDVEDVIKDPTTGAETAGPATQFRLNFMADNPASLILQADPSSIGANAVDSDTEQSEILAVVRDAGNNLVQGQRVEFTLEDVTGGRILPSFAVTDEFGRANVVYIAGSSPSAAEGVKITARLTGNPGINDVVHITVAQKAAFISLGLANTIEVFSDTIYKYNGTVLVNDINGRPVADAEVDLRVTPLCYQTGDYAADEERKVWYKLPSATCVSEDRYWEFAAERDGDPALKTDHFSKINNGILDFEEDFNRNCQLDTAAGEDSNNNGRLDSEDANCDGRLTPVNMVSLTHSMLPDVLKTDDGGFATFSLLYPKDIAQWLSVRLLASTIVAGSEGSVKIDFGLPGRVADYATTVPGNPPGDPSPYDRNPDGRALSSGMCSAIGNDSLCPAF